MNAPKAELHEFVIQLEPGVEMRIDKAKQLVALTPSNWKVNVGGNAEITAGGNAAITASGNITLTAPSIFQNGNVTTSGKDGGAGQVTEKANRTQTGSLTINGPVTINGPLAVSGGIDGKVNGCSGC